MNVSHTDLPLADNVPVHGIELSLPVPVGKKVADVVSRIAGELVEWKADDGRVICRLPKLEVWDMLSVRWSN